VAREGHVIVESKSTSEAIWKLLPRYENGGMQSQAHGVEESEAHLKADLKQTYYSFLSRLSQSVGVEPILLSTELNLLGLPGG
jgi:hypothetical protein